MKQKGLISPILIIIVLAVAILFGPKLIQEQQIFKSRAAGCTLCTATEDIWDERDVPEWKRVVVGCKEYYPRTCEKVKKCNQVFKCPDEQNINSCKQVDGDDCHYEDALPCNDGLCKEPEYSWYPTGETTKERFLAGTRDLPPGCSKSCPAPAQGDTTGSGTNEDVGSQSTGGGVSQSGGGAGTNSGTGGGSGSSSSSGGSVVGGGGNKPTDEDLRRCNEAVQKNLNIGRERCSSDTNQVGICTYAGWKSYEQLKADMKEQGWDGDYGSSTSYCKLLDAFWGQKDNKGQCVARVQEEYRRTGAPASADPWAPYKVVALGNTVNLGALNDKGRGNFSLDRVDIFLTGPDGITRNVRSDPLFKQTAQGVYAYTPNQSGHYKLVASGSSSNEIRCAVEASFDVSATCASACSQCIVNNLGGSLQYVLREGGADRWKNELTGTACPSYDAMVDHWSQKIISPPLKQYNEIKSGACALSCSDEANSLSAPPANPANVRLICTSDTKVRISWDRVPGSAYKVRLNNTTKGVWKVCNETEGDLCRDIPMWKQNPESIELPVSRADTYQVWVHASNSKGDSPGTAAVTFSCPAGVRTENAPAGPAPAVRTDPNAPRLSNLTVSPNPVQKGQQVRITGSISTGKIHVRIFPNDKLPAVSVTPKLDSTHTLAVFNTTDLPVTDSSGQPVTFATIRFQGQTANDRDLNGNNGLSNVSSDIKLEIR